jgi:tRNA pseudouridine38-40 synthase
MNEEDLDPQEELTVCDGAPHRQRYKITIAYDGTDYSGWQIQQNAKSIQGEITKAMETITQEKIKLVGSGRTDAGVHALAQVAHFDSEKDLDPLRFLGALNSLLPKTIRVKSLEKVPSNFHAILSARGKEYHYHIGIGPIHDPFNYHYRTFLFKELDWEKIRKAKEFFIGTHDFTAFSNAPQEGSVARDPVRTIYRIDIIEEPGGIRLEFEGNGFLYKMVRNIVGTLMMVGMGRLQIEDIPRLLASRDRRQVGMPASPKGLFMVKVTY